jgi:beta-galactosidase
MKFNYIPVLLLILNFHPSFAQTREVQELDSWKFMKGENDNASAINFNDTQWESVKVPHDWAIYGPFDKEIDKQTVRIVQNNEEQATEKTGRTGALPFIGTGWYRTSFEVPDFTPGKQALLAFDGAMSNAEVYVNGKNVGNWPYGYSYFYFDISQHVMPGKKNVVAVRLQNQEFSSRWYPGAGLYRKVRLIVKDKISFKHWGHFITTPFIEEGIARVNIKSQVQGENVTIRTFIRDARKVVAENVTLNASGMK